MEFTLVKVEYYTGVYMPDASQGVVVIKSDEERDVPLHEKIYEIYEIKNDAGEYEEMDGTATPWDAGSYRASITAGGVTAYLEYDIAPKSLTDTAATMAPTGGNYTGEEHDEPEVTVTDSVLANALGDGTLAKGTDYTVTYHRMVNDVLTETTDLTSGGDIIVMVTGIGNYTGSVEKTYTVNPEVVTSPVFSGLSDKYAYTGSVVEPTFTLLVTADGAGAIFGENTVNTRF